MLLLSHFSHVWLCATHGLQPTRLLHPWDSPGKNTGVGCHFLLQCMKVKVKVKSLSHVWLVATPWTATYQAPPSMGFSRQEYWSGLPLPSPKTLATWEKSYDKPRQHVKKLRHHFANKGPYCQSYGFSSSHVQMWELDPKESWAPKNWCLWTVVLEKILENPVDCKEIKQVNPKGNHSLIFTERTDAEAEAPIL